MQLRTRSKAPFVASPSHQPTMFSRRSKPQVAKGSGSGKTPKDVIKTLRHSQSQHIAVGQKHARMLELWENAIKKYLKEQSSIIGVEAATRAWYDQVRPFMTIPGKPLTATDLKYLKAVFEFDGVTVQGVNGLEEDWLIDNPEYAVVAGRRVPRDTPQSEAPIFLDSLILAVEAESPTLSPRSVQTDFRSRVHCPWSIYT